MRIPARGLVDRSAALRFTFDGTDYTGHPGDTLASALLANGVHCVATSIAHGRPRGIMSAGVEEASALVGVRRPYQEPMRQATAVELCDGLVANGLAGRGALPPSPDLARYDAKHAHCDLLVIGAGPAGLLAAQAATLSGARVILVDDQAVPGGSLLGSPESVDGRTGADWARSVVDDLAGPGTTVLTRTTAFGCYDDGFTLAVQRRTDHLTDPPPSVARHRVWRIRASTTIVATGAHERPLVFTGNDRPGVLLAGAARTYLHRYGVRAGDRAVVFTIDDSAYAAALELADAGMRISVIVDGRPAVPRSLALACAARGIDVRAEHVVTETLGADRVTGVRIAPGAGGGATEQDCDLVLVSGGWTPVVNLFSQARGPLAYSDELGAFVPGGTVPGMRVAGSAAGVLETGECLLAGRDAAVDLGFCSAADAALPDSAPIRRELPTGELWSVPAADPAGPDTRYVDLQRDATVSDILRATGAGLRSVEHVKRYTTIGTAHDQGRTSGVPASGVIAEALGGHLADTGTTTFRPPYVPVSFAALAGRDRGELHDPVRVTALHSWHVAAGAEFEDVGQWKRPWYYPADGEDMAAAVRRECVAARTGVALMDGSTLGKIDVVGPDAAAFLNLVYTNMMATLKVGFVRYGVMCGIDGMVLDDGTVARIAEDRFLITTTTGNAAMVLEWLEEWLQTEWPHLRVTLTSVTEQWVTIPLAGPKSRDVLGAVAPGLDVSNEAFGFMTWRDTTIAGVAARVCRISFSGELAYEVNVCAWDGPVVWEALLAAGEPYGITPYGTETMHVLRAEKGYPIIGQDTDGTVTPHDLGMAWAVSKKKPDFIGKRSFSRAENVRPDRKQLVGLLPSDPSAELPEGAHLVAVEQLPEPPVPMLGHITSSYHSAALGTTFALALVRGGRDRVGETLRVPVGDRLVAVTVTEPVLYDKEGARRDG
ncbi:2Fe-2S iron-sulfur cluster-binding protein [Amycolatopsis minnesotensis]|uniref:2Fe-2S iron-sulfur cluster-binding protein n=1 Tax=Amycolatopsis minnesotensis TaxID=337894 RepID=A0ABP5D0E0_9PSEU